MKIQILKIKLKNFKGIKSLEASFSKDNEITGQNRTGKTTVFDAFLWVLTGKNSEDEKNFTVKPQNEDGSPVSKVDTVVELVLDVTGQEYSLRREYREKWTKRRGSITEEMTGHTTDYFINEVPVTEKEYNQQIDGIISIDRLKLLSNPYHFNSLNWRAQIAILTEISGGEESNDAVLAENPELIPVIDRMAKENKNLHQLTKEYAAKRKKLVEEFDELPTRIDEARHNAPAYTSEREFMTEKGNLQSKIEKLEAAIANKGEAVTQQAEQYQKELALAVRKEEEAEKIKATLKQQHEAKEQEKNKTIAALRSELNSLMGKQSDNDGALKRAVASLQQYEADVAALREEYKRAAAKTFDESSCVCPTCAREYEHEQLQDMKAMFNAQKSQSLAEINTKGQSIATQIKQLQENVTSYKQQNEIIQKQIGETNRKIGELTQDTAAPDFNELAKQHPGYIAIINEAKQIRANLVIPSKVADTEALQAELAELREKMKPYDKIIADNEKYTLAEVRVNELTSLMKECAAQIADLEKVEATLTDFANTKIKLVENKVNSMFDESITFRMFNQQINGGVEDTCECLVWGVPFKDANHAGQINAGLHIINTLSKAYGVTVPVWVDNAEAVNLVIPTAGQQIRLYVTNDPKLSIINNN